MLKYATCFICAAHAAAAPETCSTMGAPWFGASPTATPLTLHRRGWGACALCGGAERLGAVVDQRAGNKSLGTLLEKWGDVQKACEFWAQQVTVALLRMGVKRKR